MKGEFEQRLRQVIDEVQASPKPIILFIDEVHTLVGAGGAAGTGDAANLLKPALARGTLRTIGATTWAEYKKHIEKDPALTRRFQVVQVPEPDELKAMLMLRGVASVLEKHHRVQLLDEAIESAVQALAPLHPGAPAARQGGEPARHGLRARRRQPARDAGRGRRLPAAHRSRSRSSRASSTARPRSASTSARAGPTSTRSSAHERERLVGLEKRWQEEKAIVDQVLALRAQLRGDDKPVDRPAAGEGGSVDAPAGAAPEAAPRHRSREGARRAARGAGQARGAAGRFAADHAVGRRAGGRQRRRRLDRHSGRPHGEERAAGDPAARRSARQARHRPAARPRHDRPPHPDLARAARQPEQADRRVHALRHLGRRQDRDRARPGRGALRRRAERHHHQHERVPGGAHRLLAQGRAARLRRLRRGRHPDRGGAAPAVQRRAARRGREGPPRRARALLPGLRQGPHGRRRRPR